MPFFTNPFKGTSNPAPVQKMSPEAQEALEWHKTFKPTTPIQASNDFIPEGVYKTSSPGREFWISGPMAMRPMPMPVYIMYQLWEGGTPRIPSYKFLREAIDNKNMIRIEDENEANRLIEEYKEYKERIAAATSSETAGGKGKKRRSTRRSKNSRRCTVKRRKKSSKV
jgi:hypothetical protein